MVCLVQPVHQGQAGQLDPRETRANQDSAVTVEQLEQLVSREEQVILVFPEKLELLVPLDLLDLKAVLDKLDSLDFLVLKAELASLDFKDPLDSKDSLDQQVRFYQQACTTQPCRYCFYSVVQKWVFRPAGATRCSDKREIWHGGPLSSPYCYMALRHGLS